MDKVIHDRAAYAAHEANRVLCLALGDNSQPKWADAPEWQRISAVKGVEMIVANPATTPEQSHEGWLAEKSATGWKYGPVKNPETKEHPCFVPYDQLPENQRLKDEMFGLVVRAERDREESIAAARGILNGLFFSACIFAAIWLVAAL